ncbi:MAG: hypothetical protein QF859_04590 [Candidatus Marinimicrobia bacterium]|jgi:hypothetical protein|nr:hypothetical protein [Candidatus Neomarinimicrobiota bacterium]|tara:strand:+ start:114 stop:737 length:624 start_codon:yes stop_codon:yes gene_type:complete
MLKKLGIVIGNNTKSGELFENLFPDFMDIKYDKPSEYINKLWSKYESQPERNANLNGKMFEYILASLCIRESILPIYMSAKVAFVPNVIYDLMFYTAEKGPICWSVKTSLRERYKQADLESIALKYVHRKALSYLVTLNENEANNVKLKIKSGDVLGLDEVVVATTNDFDDLVANLKKYIFEKPPKIKVIESNLIVTEERVKSTFSL